MTTEYDTTKLIAEAREIGGCRGCSLHGPSVLHRLADALEKAETALDESEEARLASDMQVARLAKAALPREVTWPTPEQSETDPRYEEATVDALEKVWRVEETNPGTNWMSTETKVRLGIDFYNAACRILFAPSVTPGGEEQDNG